MSRGQIDLFIPPDSMSSGQIDCLSHQTVMSGGQNEIFVPPDNPAGLSGGHAGSYFGKSTLMACVVWVKKLRYQNGPFKPNDDSPAKHLAPAMRSVP